ncbi:VOC family protein [Aestuariispira ectoiniformans]|uniref:VOC family protein n=1 Tax=Aestuariispira ectoiniformans TaxID=2775080 RepID=UPI00223BE24E|nr:VOC family protein [Aestuariispira ectoiniformans]
MTTIDRFFTNLMTSRLPATQEFYASLLDMVTCFESDWFVIMTPRDRPQFELGLIDSGSELIPASYCDTPRGSYFTFVVEDVSEIYDRAKSNGYKVIQPPRDEAYGQRRMLVEDPNGYLVDVSAPAASVRMA